MHSLFSVHFSVLERKSTYSDTIELSKRKAKQSDNGTICAYTSRSGNKFLHLMYSEMTKKLCFLFCFAWWTSYWWLSISCVFSSSYLGKTNRGIVNSSLESLKHSAEGTKTIWVAVFKSLCRYLIKPILDQRI